MKNVVLVAALAAGSLAFPAHGFTDVGVSVSVGQPGFYGRIDIGSAPRPAVIYSQPVIIHQPPVRVVQQPVYLRVPPGHAKNWSKHCGKYNACAQPVYFVQEEWYQDKYGSPHGNQHAQRGKGRRDH
jgi:hypothetical protein